MICKKCGNKMFRDHVKDNIDYMVCVNKNCTEYGCLKTKDGETAKEEKKIQERN